MVMLLLLLACTADSAKISDPPGTSGGSPTGSEGPTWHADVAPLLAARCANCHTSGGIGPFSLDSYAEAAPFANAMVAAVESGSMPPWGAESTDTCSPRFGWRDDPRLSEAEIQTLRAWSEAGAPEGDPTDAAELPEPPPVDLEDADLVVSPDTAFTVSGTEDQYMCITLDPELDDYGLFTGVQIVPGNTEVVHHVLLFSDPNGESEALGGSDGAYDCFGDVGVSDAQLLTVWVPGAQPFEVDPDAPLYVPAGSRLVMQIHYHPADQEEQDLTEVHLRRSDGGWPSGISLLTLLGNAWSASTGLADGPDDRWGFPEFRIPADSAAHTEEMSVSLGDLPDLQLFAVGTHMHYIGTDMQIDLIHADPEPGEPEVDCLLQTPRWDFAWQRIYQYDVPIGEGVEVRSGDSLRLRCTYNNTLSNPGTQAALEDGGLNEPVDVYLGEATLDEMCLGMFGVVYEL